MSRGGVVFKAVMEVRTGAVAWKAVGDDYDYVQEIARSGYGDMLYDTQRNIAYENGLNSVIKEALSSGGRADVLDIGTGTGLLSMMGGRAGATSLRALEAFAPMAAVAEAVTRANGHQSSRLANILTRPTISVAHVLTRSHFSVSIVASRSTDAEPSGGPLPNICVAELFDSELIGEGALRSFRDALERLLAPGARVVPSTARVRLLGLESRWLGRWDRLPGDVDGLQLPQVFTSCPGQVSVHDLQFDCVPRDAFKPVTPVIDAFGFNFEDAASLAMSGTWSWEGAATADGRLDALLFWWDLDMDGSGANVISTMPSFLYPPGQEQPWRDHWLAAVFYVNPMDVQKGRSLRLRGAHDEFSFWFSAEKAVTKTRETPLARPNCDCGLHASLSRRHFASISDERRYARLMSALPPINDNARVMCLGDGSLLAPLLAKKHPTARVYSLQTERRCAKFLCHINAHNKLGNSEVIGDVTETGAVDVAFVDPQFLHVMLPWHALRVWFTLAQLRKANPDIVICPKSAVLRCVGLAFRDLWKIRAKVGVVEGFDLAEFDRIQQRAILETDCPVEPQPLWEYPGTVCGPVVDVLRFPLHDEPTDVQAEATLPADGVNGVAFWLDWELGPDNWLSGGLIGSPNIGEAAEWDPLGAEAVYLLPPSSLGKSSLNIAAAFDADSAELIFEFRAT